jgi:uncharacterized protein (TIGR02001 family)
MTSLFDGALIGDIALGFPSCWRTVLKTEPHWKPLNIVTCYAASWMGVVPLVMLGVQARAADLSVPAPAAAPAPSAFDFAFGARLQSDYNFRGISQSDRRPSPQAYGEVQLFDKLFYADIAGYRVDLPTSPSAEIDLTAGIRPTFGPVSLDFGIIHYVYPDERRLEDLSGIIYTPADTNFTDLAAKASWSVNERFTLGAGVFHAWDWLGSGAPGTYANVTAKYVLPPEILDGLFISAELGFYSLGTTSPDLGSVKLVDYAYWNAGIGFTKNNVTLDLRYHDTDLSKGECFINTTDPSGITSDGGRSNWCSAAFVATLSVDFTAGSLMALMPRN